MVGKQFGHCSTHWIGIGMAVSIAAVMPSPAEAQGRDLSGLDVCRLVPSDALIELLMARRLGSSRDVSRAGVRACRYHYSIGPEACTPEIALLPPEEFDRARARVPAERMREFRGLGHASFVTQANEMIVLYAVKRNDVAVRITLRGRMDDPDDVLHARVLASQALNALHG